MLVGDGRVMLLAYFILELCLLLRWQTSFTNQKMLQMYQWLKSGCLWNHVQASISSFFFVTLTL